MFETKKAPRINFASTDEARKQRIETIEKYLNLNLNHINKTSYSTKDISGNIESFIGSIEIPVGIAGPIKMIDENGEAEEIYAPVATNEGALVASLSRGAYSINLAGGFHARVAKQRMSRCPMFSFQSMVAADKFTRWIENSFDLIKNEAEKFSNYAKLITLDPQLFGKHIHLKFDYETADASGQNMTTTCTWNACLFIEKLYNEQTIENQRIENFVIEANGSSDKKISSRSRISTRGIKVTSECFIPEKIINKIMKTTSKEIVDLYIRANAIAHFDGMVGYNVNVANAIAAFFASTGQDLACIHESSVGILQMELEENGLYVALTLPSLVIGTVGGGTALAGANESLKILNCSGANKVERLAKIICGFAMGLEVSTMSAITSGQFATSHERLGRNRPVDWLKAHELNLDFFETKLEIKNIMHLQRSNVIKVDNGIVSSVTARVSKKLIGFYPFELTINNKVENIIFKLKPLDDEILLGFEIIAGLVSPKLKELYQTWKLNNSFIKSHVKEIDLYKIINQSNPQYIPKLYGSVKDSNREIYGVAIEYLKSENTFLLNSENNPEKWSLESKKKVIKAISEIHNNFFDTPIHLETKIISLQEKINLIPFYLEILSEAKNNLKWIQEDDILFFKNIIDGISQWYVKYLEIPQTLIHNDFNPRNLCFHNDIPCFYDWELAQNAPAQRDLIEFIAFTSSDIFSESEFEELVTYHFDNVYKETEINISIEEWKRGLLFSAYEFLTDRLSFYMIGNIINQYDFLERVYKNTKVIIKYLETDIE